MKKFIKNTSHVFEPALPFDFAQDKLRLPSLKAWTSVVGLLLVLGVSLDSLQAARRISKEEMEMLEKTTNEETSSTSEQPSEKPKKKKKLHKRVTKRVKVKKESTSRKKVEKKRGGSVPTKDEAEKMRKSTAGKKATQKQPLHKTRE